MTNPFLPPTPVLNLTDDAISRRLAPTQVKLHIRGAN